MKHTPRGGNTTKGEKSQRSLLRAKMIDLSICVGGIYICFMIMGLLQEKM